MGVPKVVEVGSARVSRLLVFGDLHCDRRHLRGLVERAVDERCDALVSLGDVCYLPRDPEGRRFLRSTGALLCRAGLELLLVDGNHDDGEALADARTRTPAAGPVPLGFRLHHPPSGTRFRLGRLRCLAYGGAFAAGRLDPVATGTGPPRASGRRAKLVLGLIEDSYALVVDRLTKRERDLVARTRGSAHAGGDACLMSARPMSVRHPSRRIGNRDDGGCMQPRVLLAGLAMPESLGGVTAACGSYQTGARGRSSP